MKKRNKGLKRKVIELLSIIGMFILLRLLDFLFPPDTVWVTVAEAVLGTGIFGLSFHLLTSKEGPEQDDGGDFV